MRTLCCALWARVETYTSTQVLGLAFRRFAQPRVAQTVPKCPISGQYFFQVLLSSTKKLVERAAFQHLGFIIVDYKKINSGNDTPIVEIHNEDYALGCSQGLFSCGQDLAIQSNLFQEEKFESPEYIVKLEAKNSQEAIGIKYCSLQY